MKAIESIKQQFQKLPAAVQRTLLDELLHEQELKSPLISEVIQESADGKRKPCPYCNSVKVYKRGLKKDVQSYQCRSCLKWFSQTTGTPLWDIKHKHKWQDYLKCMQEGMSIKKTAKHIGISIQTSFDWRHKILATLASRAPEKLEGVVECDEMEIPISLKGSRHIGRKPRKRSSDFKRNEDYSEVSTVQVVTVVQRGGAKYLKAVESKRLTSSQIKKALKGRLEPNTTLITDNHPSYKAFASKQKKLKHKTITAKEHVSKANRKIHLQTVNNTHGQLRQFLLPFHGVSTKYLQNYLNWFAYGKALKESKSTLKAWITAILTTPMAYELFLSFKQNAVNIRT